MSHKQFVRHVPDAKTAVLFIHGFLGSPRHFDEFVRMIPEDIAVYNILLEGHNAGVREFGLASMEKWKTQADKAVCELINRYGSLVIVAHSMGTFFAMEAAVKYPQNVKSIMLLQTPLKIGVKAAAPINTVKSFFSDFSRDPVIKIYHNAHSVKLNIRVWEYVKWIPRYLELFEESKKSRELILKLTTPTFIFQSRRDELVSMQSVKYIPDKENIHLTVLDNSAHFIYRKKDFDIMLDAFAKLI